jgi:hypothetical protein
MAHVNRRIGKSSETANVSADGTGGGVLDAFIYDYFNRSGNVSHDPGFNPDAGMTASGGIISDYTVGPTVYRAHIFTSSGTFDVTKLSNSLPNSIDYLVVAGGGGTGSSGTSDRSGGGGAGGFRTNLPGHPLAGSPLLATVQTYTVTVGAGGGGGAGTGPDIGGSNHNGSPSVFGAITSTGGGGGGAGHGTTAVIQNGAPGGSGGGAGYLGPGVGGSGSGSAGSGNTPPSSPPQGNDGGTTQGGGGGGAGGAGSNGPNGAGGAGSPIAIETNTAKTYAAGGFGGDQSPANNGAANTGDGGDGDFNAAGFAGGSGIVVVRYKIGSVESAKATGGNISFYNNKTIHTFTSSGTFTNTSPSALTVEYVVIGGGGAGASFGGGGAGAYRTGTTPVSTGSPNAVSVQVGGGGAEQVGEISPGVPTSDYAGTPSYFGTPITAPGGGGGGHDGNNGGAGGSGGGGSGVNPPTAGPAPGSTTFPGTIGATPPSSWWGAAGGTGTYSATYTGAGGGGAGGAGANAVDSTNSGSGGPGVQLPTTFRDPKSTVGAPGPTSAPTPNGFDTSGKYWVAGGGSGGIGPRNSPHNFSPSYVGGGGGAPMANGERNSYAGAGVGGYTNGPPGSTTTTLTGIDASENTGSGGGGGLWANNGISRPSGSGGSGLVLIAYPT